MQIQRILQTIDNKNLLIQVPESFVNKQVEILVITLDDFETKASRIRRMPPSNLCGRVKEKGDVVSSVSAEDWRIPSRSHHYCNRFTLQCQVISFDTVFSKYAELDGKLIN